MTRASWVADPERRGAPKEPNEQPEIPPKERPSSAGLPVDSEPKWSDGAHRAARPPSALSFFPVVLNGRCPGMPAGVVKTGREVRIIVGVRIVPPARAGPEEVEDR